MKIVSSSSGKVAKNILNTMQLLPCRDGLHFSALWFWNGLLSCFGQENVVGGGDTVQVLKMDLTQKSGTSNLPLRNLSYLLCEQPGLVCWMMRDLRSSTPTTPFLFHSSWSPAILQKKSFIANQQVARLMSKPSRNRIHLRCFHIAGP